MLHDRGTKKWTSLMLPEHAEALKKLFAEYERKEKPVLDEQQLLENESAIQEAIENDLDVDIRYFKDYDFHVARGKILFIEMGDRSLHLDNEKIKLDNIIEVNIF